MVIDDKTKYVGLNITSLQYMIDNLISPIPSTTEDLTKYRTELALRSILFLAKQVKSLREEINKLKSEQEPAK